MAYTIVDEVMAADKSGLTGTDVAVLLAVAWHADGETREAFPGNPRLAQESGVSPRGVRMSIAKLSSPEASFQWLRVTYERYHKRILTVAKDLPMRKSLPNDAEESSAQCGREFPGAEEAAAYAEESATEPVSNRSENQSVEPVTEPPPPDGGARVGSEVRTPEQPITGAKDFFDYLRKQVAIAARDHDLPRPGGVNDKAVFARIRKIREEDRLSIPDLVELADLYVKAPSLWNPLTHPVMDFFAGTTQARLRNRRHEIRVTSSEPALAPLRNEKAWAALEKFAEGSD